MATRSRCSGSSATGCRRAISFSGPPFPLVPADEIGLSCFLENTIVHPEERRRGHHRTLLDARISAADAMGKCWVCAGVHLENRRSWSNLLAAGLAIVGMRRDFGYPVIGLLRPADRGVLTTDAGSDRPVAVADVEAHDAALLDGWVGLRLVPEGRVLYRRLTGGLFELRTGRLVLRRWRLANREPFAHLKAGPRVLEHLLGPLSRAESDTLTRAHRRAIRGARLRPVGGRDSGCGTVRRIRRAVGARVFRALHAVRRRGMAPGC